MGKGYIHVRLSCIWSLFLGILSWMAIVPHTSLRAQRTNLGLPYVQQVTKQTYRAGTQNWGFAQDAFGNVFIANNDGLLVYNGKTWTTYPLPNRTIARSLAYHAETGRLYIGGQDAIGYFSPDTHGCLVYTDIKTWLPKGQDAFSDVWHTYIHNGRYVLFQSDEGIYVLEPGSGGRVDFANPVIFLGRSQDQTLIQERGRGLHAFADGKFQLLPGTEALADKPIAGIMAGDAPGTFWIATIKDGLFRYDGRTAARYAIAQQEWLLRHPVERATRLSDGRLALATTDAGLVIIDVKKQRIHQHLNKNNGLQNNTIRALFSDSQDNLWLGLDNGLDIVNLRAPLSRFIPDPQMESTTYAIRIFNEQLYVGTSNGLYVAPWKNYYDPIAEAQPFRLVPGSRGQVWGLSVVHGRLWMGHHEGAFQVIGDQLLKYMDGLGYWTFLPWPGDDGGGAVLAGHYYGLRLLHQNESRPISSLKESARVIAMDTKMEQVWVSHPYRGVYRIPLNTEAPSPAPVLYGQAKGLPSDLENYVFNILGQLLVCAERGVYRYQAEADNFVLDVDFNAHFPPNTQLRRLQADPANNIWYISRTEAGVLKITQRGLTQQIERVGYPELRAQLVAGFELVYPYDKEHVFFGAEKGVVLLDPSQDVVAALNAPPQINALYQRNDSLVWTGQFAGERAAPLVFHHQQNAFRISFIAPVYGAPHVVEYQYYLSDTESEYGHWTEKSDKEFTNLPPGDYTFHCRARLNGGEPSAPAVLRIHILPPWYQTRMAYALYALALLTGLLLVIFVPRKRFAKKQEALVKEQEKQAIAYQQEVEAGEKTIDQLKSEAYQHEIDFKNKELASLTMHLVQKNELINKIASEIEKLGEKLKGTPVQKNLRPLQQLLTEDETLENDWEQFVYHFDQVHSGFFQRLRQKYPELTPRDHRLCAYLRMNLSTKDIAPLLNISVRGVEISRYRLRKKLGLSGEDNLGEFMMNF